MGAETALQWGLLAAQAAMKILDKIQDEELRREAAAETRQMLTDQKLLLRAEAQEMLMERKRRG